MPQSTPTSASDGELMDVHGGGRGLYTVEHLGRGAPCSAALLVSHQDKPQKSPGYQVASGATSASLLGDKRFQPSKRTMLQRDSFPEGGQNQRKSELQNTSIPLLILMVCIGTCMCVSKSTHTHTVHEEHGLLKSSPWQMTKSCLALTTCVCIIYSDLNLRI